MEKKIRVHPRCRAATAVQHAFPHRVFKLVNFKMKNPAYRLRVIFGVHEQVLKKK